MHVFSHTQTHAGHITSGACNDWSCTHPSVTAQELLPFTFEIRHYKCTASAATLSTPAYCSLAFKWERDSSVCLQVIYLQQRDFSGLSITFYASSEFILTNHWEKLLVLLFYLRLHTTDWWIVNKWAVVFGGQFRLVQQHCFKSSSLNIKAGYLIHICIFMRTDMVCYLLSVCTRHLHSNQLVWNACSIVHAVVNWLCLITVIFCCIYKRSNITQIYLKTQHCFIGN